MKKVIVILLMLIAAPSVFAQENPLKKAVDLYQAGKLEEAKSAIEKCSSEKPWSEDPNTWYLQGFIMKDLYKKSPQGDSAIIYRELATLSFKRLIENEEAKKHHVDAYKNLKFISSTFYNDAISAIESQNLSLSQSHFEHFKNNLLLSKDSLLNLKEKETEYLLALGTAFTTIYKGDSLKAEENLMGAKMAYEKILAMDSTNSKANYNLAVLFYNEAVNMINELDYDEVDLVAFSQIEDKSIVLFKQSLPFMEKAYQQNPNDRNTIEGLAGIYFSLRDYDKSNEYKEKLNSIEEN